MHNPVSYTLPPAVQAAYDYWAQCEIRLDVAMQRNERYDASFHAAYSASESAHTALRAACEAHGIDPDSLDNPEHPKY